MKRNHLDEQLRWFAFYTRYKREKYICNLLVKSGIICYVPLIKRIRQYNSKVRQVELPLINCYVFAKIRKVNSVTVLSTPGVVNFVKFSSEIISIPEQEIELLRRVVGDVQDVDVVLNSFETGDEVEIIAGNLTGVKGILISGKNKNNFLIELERMGYSLRIEVDPSHLRKTANKRTVADRELNSMNKDR